ncbi:MAG: hypothetical protein HYW89_03165 [Candidatus Sungiibacteriota bacterium]|uniref:Uncharacterized protein n=1 Tax=Candidatus Sungiibacteriota bacterium TaxID=2750080 RepID=A0A7T5RIY6_9BACT|nr:MAG: hypothetical protein HYW89_03165 [Candidatus Sungbacteria bacterium]
MASEMTEHGEVFKCESGNFVGFGGSSSLAKILLAAEKEFPGVLPENLEVYCTDDRDLYLAPKSKSK